MIENAIEQVTLGIPAHYYLFKKEVGCESLGPQPPQGQEYFQKLSCVFNRP
jgi:hypothetical protein